MPTTWRDRLAQLLKETPGMSMKRLSLKAGMSESGVRDILSRGRSPSIDAFVAIAEALGVDASYLLTGAEGHKLKIPVIGVVDGADTWEPMDGVTTVEAIELRDPDVVGLEVRGDALSPAYRDKDFLICRRQVGRYAQNLIGLDCAVLTVTGERYLKILKKGGRHGLFNLKSVRPLVDDLENVALEWAAPVVWVKRGGR